MKNQKNIAAESARSLTSEAASYVLPETELEYAIINNPEWLKGAFWEEPRHGHPEGKVIYHIQEVLKNVDALHTDAKTREQLRLISIIHDTFKYREDRSYPRIITRHHAYIAYKFAAEFTQDQEVLNTILLHDNAYYAWLAINHNKLPAADRLLSVVYDRMASNMQLYYLFFKCDTLTGDKTLEPLYWFETTGKGFSTVELLVE